MHPSQYYRPSNIYPFAGVRRKFRWQPQEDSKKSANASTIPFPNAVPDKVQVTSKMFVLWGNVLVHKW